MRADGAIPAAVDVSFVTWLVVEHAKTIRFIKSCAFFFVMLPVKAGLEQTIAPFTWGFELSAPRRAAPRTRSAPSSSSCRACESRLALRAEAA